MSKTVTLTRRQVAWVLAHMGWEDEDVRAFWKMAGDLVGVQRRQTAFVATADNAPNVLHIVADTLKEAEEVALADLSINNEHIFDYADCVNLAIRRLTIVGDEDVTEAILQRAKREGRA